MSSRNSIQVCIKVRPLLPRERDLVCLWQVKDNSIHQIESQSEPYIFDFIFDQDISNQIIFDKMAKNIVHACVKGFNGTIFAYGQTSSGKTYTMMGNEKNPGVMVLAAKEIFRQIEQNADREFLLRIGYIEIYNEKIYDLLNKKNMDLKIKEAATGIVSVNCEEYIITSEEELLHHLCLGNKERTVGETNMNERSSRSHAIFRIIIESRKTDRTEDDTVIQSVLNLVDLAGSERADQTGATGARLKEGGHINKSLLFLSNVIKRLSENEDHKYISYRDSKLTRILQASLGGNALTSIICTIKPTTVEETQSTLNFAMRAKSVKNKPQLNEIVSEATVMKRLEREIKQLKNLLDEERKKNESQHKVGQLEQRLKTDMLKIISGNSLNNVRNQKDKRRRTWCPTSSLPNGAGITSNLAVPSITSGLVAPRSQLPKPNFFASHVTTRDCAPKTINIFKSLDVEIVEEEVNFKPAESFDFDTVSFHTPKAHNSIENNDKLSLTPSFKQLGIKGLEKIEKDFLELQNYTNLEKQISVEHDIYEALKEKLDIVTSERDRLANERLTYIEVEADFNDTKQKLITYEKRCDDLQVQISKLTHANRVANEQIEKYEEQLAELKNTNSKLEMENREAVSLEFEYQSHKNKSKQREMELLSLLSEKEHEIDKLQQKLDAVSEDIMRNTKNDIMQETRAVDGSICVKCDDLQRLLEENKKIAVEFDNLTKEYEKLQFSYQQVSEDAARAHVKLNELEQSKRQEAAECDELRNEIATLSAKLTQVQLAYEQMSCEQSEKSKACKELERIVETAHEELRVLQGKYEKLELVRQEQQQAIVDIQSEYSVVQMKFENLQLEYEVLEKTSVNSKEFCERLQTENKNLEIEIGLLKERVEETQRSLLDEAERKKSSDAILMQLNDLKEINDGLRAEINKSQKEFNDLQQEYNDLSNQLLESIQESELLREKLLQTEEKFKNVDLQLATALKTSTCESQCSDTESMKSSTVRTESNDLDNILSKFALLSESLHEIEMEHKTGVIRSFRAKETPSSGQPARKLCIKNIQEIVALDTSNTDIEISSNSSDVCLQGLIKQHHFQIINITNSKYEYDTNNVEQEEAALHIARLEKDIEEKNALLEATERTLNEMREQMTTLECALLEKTVIVETLEKQVKECTMGESMFKCEDGLNDTLGTSTSETPAEISTRIMQSELETKLMEMQKNNTMLLEETHAKEKILEERAADISALQSNKQNLELKISQLEDSLEELNIKFVAAAELNGKLEKNILDLTERFSSADAMNTALKEKFENVQVKLNEKDIELRNHLTAIKALKMKCVSNDYTTEIENAKIELSELRQQNEDLRNELENTKSKCKQSEKCYKDEINNLNLELYQKLEVSEGEFRQNLKKYNSEWEQSKLSYEQKIENLMEQLALKQQQLDEEHRKCEELNAELQMVKDELSRLQNIFSSDMEQQKTELQSIIAGLRAELLEKQNCQEENIKLIATIESLESKHQELQETNCAIKNEYAQFKENVNLQVESYRSKNEQQMEEFIELKTETDNYIETLRTEKNAIQLQLDKQMNELKDLKNSKAETEIILEKSNIEKIELKLELERYVSEIEELNLKLLTYNQLEVENRKLSLQLEAIKTECEAKISTQHAYDMLRSKYESSMQEFERQQQELREAQARSNEYRREAEDKAQTLQDKLESLMSDLQSLEAKVADYDSLVKKQEETTNSLVESRNAQAKLSEQVIQLERQLESLVAAEQSRNNEIESLKNELETKKEAVRTLSAAQNAMTDELNHAHQNASTMQHLLQVEVADLEGKISELQLKCDSLQAEKDKLEKSNAQISQQLQHAIEKSNECETLSNALLEAKNARSELEKKLVNTLDEAGKCSKKLREELLEAQRSNSESQDAYKKLRDLLDSKESSSKKNSEKLEGTISCLLSEKKKLEERLDLTESTIKRLETEILALQRKSESANASFESNGSITSPMARKSLDRMMGDANLFKSGNIKMEDKVIAIQQKSVQLDSECRRNRRLSTHDERRRQSYWGATREVGSMTDPMDPSCKCVELNSKLGECERNLYISEGLVKSLRMEIKNHPLKDENALIKKKLSEEQEKIKRLKQKNHELSAQINSLSVSSATKPSTSPKPLDPVKIVATVEVQTESDMNTCIQDLQLKYQDCLNVLRFRYRLIKDLERQLEEKENMDSSNVSSHDLTQLSTIKNENESLKSELSAIKEKYGNAKIVLTKRRLEIEKLREKLSQVLN